MIDAERARERERDRATERERGRASERYVCVGNENESMSFRYAECVVVCWCVLMCVLQCVAV